MFTRPTPLQQSNSLAEVLGVDLWLKREDALDELGSGHKVRKLVHVLATAQKEHATVLVTAGSLPSSQTTAVAIAAVRNGLKAHVVYLGDEQSKPRLLDGPYMATCLAAPRLTWFERRPWSEVDEALADVCKIERERGERPFVIVPGVSEAGGLHGSVELGLELATQVKDRFAHIVVPVGSGGTALGIAVAAMRRNLKWTVHGACIASTAVSTRARIRELALRYGVDGNVRVTDVALGAGYGATSATSLDLARNLAVKHGVTFDPTYMLKAYEALCHLVSTGAIPVGRQVILVHTGGTWGAYCGTSPIARHVRLAAPTWLSSEDPL